MTDLRDDEEELEKWQVGPLVDERLIEILTLMGQDLISQNMWSLGPTPTFVVRQRLEGLAIEIQSRICGEQVGQITLRAPADWWQHFKERWAPRWWLRRWPVRYRTQVADVKAVFPDYAPPPSMGRSFRIAVAKWPTL